MAYKKGDILINKDKKKIEITKVEKGIFYAVNLYKSPIPQEPKFTTGYKKEDLDFHFKKVK